MTLLPIVDRLPRRTKSPVPEEALSVAADILDEVQRFGEAAIRKYANRFDTLDDRDPLVLTRASLEDATDRLPAEQREVLERVAGRIHAFASAQRDALVDLDIAVPGGRAGHRWIPVSSVGAYAPGGRHPLPSSVLMTVIPARVAGVDTVWVASPRPTDVTLAAAAIAGADGLLPFGGATAIGALAFGTVSPACDLIVGPGNKYVTAAKKILYGEVGIDGLAGPSEILVIADQHADPALVAADLLAQAEHDDDAVPMLISTSLSLIEKVENALETQLADLPTSETARNALGNGFALHVETLGSATDAANQVAPEHLAIHVAAPIAVMEHLDSYGSVFMGENSAEVFADYGVGPNHVLPTAGGARFQSGLSVLTFLKASTWSRLDDPTPLVEDTVLLARLEGLEAHARAALMRADGATG